MLAEHNVNIQLIAFGSFTSPCFAIYHVTNTMDYDTYCFCAMSHCGSITKIVFGQNDSALSSKECDV